MQAQRRWLRPILWLLCTPPAAAGVLVFQAASRGKPTSAPGVLGALVRLATRAAVATVVLCTFLLAVAAIWAGVEGLHQLTLEPQIHHIGQTEPSQFDRDQARKAGIFWLVLSLWAAWSKRR